MVGFSAMMGATDRAIKEFLWTNMYRHPRVIDVMTNAEEVVRDLFARFFVQPQRHAGRVGAGACRCATRRRARGASAISSPE